jgi:predicted secreted protein
MLSRKQVLFSIVALLPAMAIAATPDSQPTTASVNAHVSVEVPQDLARASLYVEQTGADRAAIVSDVNGVLQRALSTAKAKGVTAKTAGYRSYLLYDKNQHVSGYRVRADIALESKDFEAFSKALTSLSTSVSIQDVGYAVSDDALKAVKSKLLTDVAAEFRSEAGSITHAFGFNAYDIKDLNVNYDTGLRAPVMMKAMAMAAPAAPMVPMSVEPGTATVSANANGSIALH